jgi:hypothetical protein
MLKISDYVGKFDPLDALAWHPLLLSIAGPISSASATITKQNVIGGYVHGKVHE